MKLKFNQQYRNRLILLGSILLLIASCKKTDFPVDESAARAFHPSRLSANNIAATSVELVWPTVPGIKDYIIELSRDSLLFGNIVSTITINSDTIPAGTDEIHMTLRNLFGNTNHSARIKTTSLSGVPDSKYISLFFKTKAEQIMSAVGIDDVSYASVTLKWLPGSSATHLLLTSVSLNPIRVDLTEADKAAGSKTVSGLNGGTVYTAEIYNTDANRRGSVTFKTYSSAPSDGEVITLLPTDSIHNILAASAATKIVLILPRGVVYGYNSGLVLKPGVSITFWGEPGSKKPIMAFNGITLPSSAGTIKFENIDLTGYQYDVNKVETTTKRNYIFNQSLASLTDSVIFENCIIRNFVNTPFRMQGSAAITVDKLVFNNCIAFDCGNNGSTGTYSFINTNVATGKVNNIRITNSSFYNIGYSLILHNLAGSQSVKIQNCTFNDMIGDGRYFIDYNAQIVGSFILSDCIFGKTKSPAATAKGIRIAGAGISTLVNCYNTNDFVITPNTSMTILNAYNGPSTSLFVNPSMGDFNFLDINFVGMSNSGDPRWRK